jgi:sulfonate transport system substrate-binding protein
VVWDPYYSISQQHYKARVIADTSDKRLASASYYLAHKDFAARYPATLAVVLDEIGKITRWSGDHRDELSAIAAEATGIDAKTWSTAFNRAEYTFGPVTPAHVAQQQQLADAFLALGVIPRKINVADIVWQAPRP